MHCVAAVHGPVAPSVHCTALDAGPDGTCWSGAADGSITCWRRQQLHAEEAVTQPLAVLQGHSHPVVALLSGLTAPEASSSSSAGGGGARPTFLLSLDAEGWVGLWDCSSWVCLDMTRAAPLTPACTPDMTLMPDGEHVCIIIPATPNLQQEQQTLWQHQRQHQQQQAAHSSPLTSPQQQQQYTSPTGPATAANLSPMMLVLRWQSLALVAAPLVSNLGLVALTSSSITLDQADAVVASAVIRTAPALAPTAADTVVLAVMRSGWMWAGSLAGSSLSQAWEKPLVSGGSSAPLRHSCLWATSSSSDSYSRSAGGSSSPEPCKRSAALQLQLLVVQPDGWRLFVCSSFSSTDGMPQQWTQLAQQLHGPSYSRLHSHSSRRQDALHGRLAAGTAAASAGGRVRFYLGASQTGQLGAEGYGDSRSSCSSGSSSGSSEMSEDSGHESAGEAEEQAVDTEGDGHVGRKGSRLRRAAGPAGRQHRQHEQGLLLLGGTLLQSHSSDAVNCGVESLQGRQLQVQAAAVAVLVWAECGEQQLWSVLQQPDSSAALQHQQQQQQAQLVQQLMLQPWPAHAAVKLFAAVDRLHSSVSLLIQHSRHIHHHHHHHHHQQHSHSYNMQQRTPGGVGGRDADWIFSDVPHKWRSDWHLHCMQLHSQGPQQAADSGVTAMQQVQLQLSHCQGAVGAAWSTHAQHADLQTDSGSIDQHISLQDQQQQQPEADSGSSVAGVDAMQLDTDGTAGSSSRKRPAADEPAAEPATDSQVGCGPDPGRAKQPRVHLADLGLHRTGQQAAGGLAAASLRDGQQQQVTHMLLLGSDAPGMHQVAVILASGAILFYDLATYCVPGAAWHPDCCVVGSGHTGRVSTTLEVTFKCPPQHLLGCAGVVDSTHGSLPRPVNWQFSSAAAGRGDQSTRSSVDAGASSSGDASASRSAHVHGQCYEPVPDCPAAAQGWSRRPAQGLVVPLLLTGGKDGSLRAWDLRLQHLGQTWMAVHPHAVPVEAIVLPPVSSRLPWSTCVLSVCMAGRVALTCLASGITTRTFDGWDLGPPAQLAWSTGRGLLAAGGWDAAGVWQVAVWDIYSGHMDRQLQGAAAHMLMASLAQELTSSMRHLSRAQAQPHAPAAATGASAVSTSVAGQHTSTAAAAGLYGLASNGYGQYHNSSVSGSKRASLDIPYSSSQAASSDGTKVSSSSGGVDTAGGFVPRLQLVHHTGPLKPVPYGKQDVLLLDVNVQQLMLQLEAYSKQQKRENSRQRQQNTGSRSNSIDIDSSTASARASRASSLDLLGLLQGGSPAGAEGCMSVGASAANSSRTSPQQQQQQYAPRAGALAGQLHALQGTAAAMPRQGSVALAVGAAAEQGCMQGAAQAGVGTQQQLVHGRAVMVPAVAAALQGLCLLHKWGLEPQLDKQLVLLLGQLQGWPDSGLGQLLMPSSSTPRSMSPTTPTGPSAGAVATTAAAAAGMDTDMHSGTLPAEAQPLQLLMQLQHLLEGPASGSPVLQAAAPCLTQEVLLSPRCHAAVIALPTAHSSGGFTDRGSSQQQEEFAVEQEQRKSSAAGSGARGHAAVGRPSCLLLAACPSLRSCRLLTLVAVSKWLMASIPSHTSVNTCSGLVTLYALHSTELLTQAAAPAAAAAAQPHAPAATSAAGAASPASPGAAGSSIRGASPLQAPHTAHQQQQQQYSGDAPQAPLLPDLLLIASTSLACPGLLAEAAQLLLAALLHPAPPGTYLLPALGHTQPVAQLGWASPQLQQQQQRLDEAVSTSPGAAAAASCWPPAVLQLAVLHAQQHQQHQANSPAGSGTAAAGSGFSLQQLPLWLPQLVLSAAAAVAHPTRVPPELLAAVSAGLLDVLLGAAPAQSSCVAASWLCQVLRGGHWGLWRPYLGKPGHLAQRLCHLVDRLQASSTDSRTAASHLVNQSLSTAPGMAFANTSSSSSSGANNSTSTGADFVLLTQQPYAIADPLAASSGGSKSLSSSAASICAAGGSSSTGGAGHGSGWTQWRPQHVEGGLFLSAALMGSTGAASQGAWGAGVGVSRSASPAAGAVAGLLEVSPVGRTVQAGGSGAFNGSGGFSGSGVGLVAGNASGAQQQQQYAGMVDLHRTTSGITYSYTAVQHNHWGSTVSTAGGSSTVGSTVSVKYSQITSGVSSISQQQQQQQGVGVRVSRSVLVVWLRAALDVLAALTHVDPAAVLMELSHKLAAPGAESSGSSLTLLMAALSRLLKRPSERHSLLPHLGFITALAVQALDPTRPLLRHTLLQPVMAVIRDLSEHFHQVDCHSSSLQVAVGSTRALAGPYSGAAAPGVGGGASVSCIQAPTVAVFDMNGGTKKKVLLLPVLMDEPDEQQQQQQQQQGVVPGQRGLHHAPAGPVHGHGARHVGPFGSTSSLQSASSSASASTAAADAAAGQVPVPHMSGALPGLWSTAEGVAGATAAGPAGGRPSSGWSGVLGGSSSSLSSSTAFDTPGDSMRGSSAGLGELQRGTLAANTMTRAEAAMVEGWFGGSTGSSSDGAAPAAGATSMAAAHTVPGSAGMVGGVSSVGATAGAGYGGASHHQPSSMQCGVIYPDAASANSPVLCASEVAGGVAAVAFSPGGDAVAAFVLGCHCLVVWRLGASWTQKLAHLGSSRPMSQMPHAYIRLPQAALLVNAVFKDSTAGAKQQQQQQQNHRHHVHHHHHGGQEGDDGEGVGEVLQWQLKWQTDSHIDLLYQGCLCGSVEVHL